MTVLVCERTVFYDSIEISIENYSVKEQFSIPFTANHVIITNESNNQDIEFSFDGSTRHGELFGGETPVTFDGLEINKIWIKRLAPGGSDPIIRVWAWRRNT